ncbi:MAG: DnaB-like helicase C-terminal domain-containing protein [Nitrospira sp.]
MIEQTQHVSAQTERYILGSMIMDVEALITAADQISWEMFYERKNQLVFNALIDIYKETGKTDITILDDFIRGQEATRKLIDSVYLCALTDDVVTTANILSHTKIIKKLYLLRRVELFGMSVMENAKFRDDPDALIREASSQLIDLADEQVEKKDPTVPAIMAEVHEKWKDIKEGKQTHIPTSELLFGDMIPGWYPGHFNSIAAYTSAGKSTLLAQIMVDAGREGASQIIFSLEDSRHERMYKLLANIADVPQRAQISGTFGNNDKARLKEAEEEMREWPLLIYSDVRAIEGMRLKILKAKMRGKVDIVAIDFIQNIVEPGKLYDRMSYAALTLQAMAQDLEFTLILLSQIDNETAKNPNSKFIGMKGAGEIAAASDAVIWMAPEGDKKGGMERDLRISLKKNRKFGPLGGRDFEFSPRWTRIQRRNEWDDGRLG